MQRLLFQAKGIGEGHMVEAHLAFGVVREGARILYALTRCDGSDAVSFPWFLSVSPVAIDQ
jgi:hypothetical protein